MLFTDGDWVGLAPPKDMKYPDIYAALSTHVRKVEDKVETRPAEKYRPFWSGRVNKQCLRHYFNRALYVPGVDTILREILDIACGEYAMYESQSWRAANMLLTILTNPSCSHIPVESYPQLAKALLPTVRQFHHAPERDQIVIALKLAADLASTVTDSAFGGATARVGGPRDAQDSTGPVGR
jgi:hypothetical protein